MFDLIVAPHGVTLEDIDQMDLETLVQRIGQLRATSPDDTGLSDKRIATLLRGYAYRQLHSSQLEARQMPDLGKVLGIKRTSWHLWLDWLLANAVGLLLCFEAVNYVYPTVADLVTELVGSFIGEPVGVVLGWSVGGAAIGTAQWIVLRKRGKYSSLWVLSNIVGWTLVNFVLWNVLEPGFILLAVIGLAVGAAQWLILRKRVHHSGWWVLSSAIGLGIGGLIGNAAMFIMGSLVGRALGVNMVKYLSTLVFGAANGAVTGPVLIALLEHPIPEDNRKS